MTAAYGEGKGCHCDYLLCQRHDNIFLMGGGELLILLVVATEWYKSGTSTKYDNNRDDK